jgi:Di-haem oxidoreductase, putative peroxidase
VVDNPANGFGIQIHSSNFPRCTRRYFFSFQQSSLHQPFDRMMTDTTYPRGLAQTDSLRVRQCSFLTRNRMVAPGGGHTSLIPSLPFARGITAAPGTVINGGTYTVSAAIGNKMIHPYGDFLLHDIGTGDGIVQAGPADTANKLRTAPLWGLHIKTRFMHDLGSLTLEDAILRHKHEAAHVTRAFSQLTPAQQQQLITFLKSL